MLSHFSCIQLFATVRTGVHQAPLSMGFSRQEHRNGLPCPPPGDLPNPGIELMSPASPAMQVDSLLLNHQGSPHVLFSYLFYIYIAPVCMYVCVCIYIYMPIPNSRFIPPSPLLLVSIHWFSISVSLISALQISSSVSFFYST